MEKKISKRLSLAIINSYSAGVVPRIGLEHVVVGRKKEIETILSDLKNIEEGASTFRILSGRYGSGKSFLIQVIRNYAMDRGFVVADVDLSPQKRLLGTKQQGLATYREILERLSTKLRPDGGALEALLQKWINTIKTQLITEENISVDNPEFIHILNKKIYTIIEQMESYVHGFDFSYVLSAYYKGYTTGNDGLKQAAIRWLRGEFSTKTEAKKYLNVGEIIQDENWYDYIKLFSRFFTQLGYSGFIVFIDECVNLYKITHRGARENNYEKLLEMFNDTLQGKSRSLGLYFGGTPECITDERRGLYSYEALQSRLVGNKYLTTDYVNFSGPVIKLTKLTFEELIVLMEKIVFVYEGHNGCKVRVTNNDLVDFLQLMTNTLGSEELVTPREIIREFIGVLDILNQNEHLQFKDVIKGKKTTYEHKEESSDIFAEFEI